jgi:hypothetical protein
VRREGGDVWSLSNALGVCEHCHMNHHAAFRRIPMRVVPDEALDFAVRLIGRDRALLFFGRFYSAVPTQPRRIA